MLHYISGTRRVSPQCESFHDFDTMYWMLSCKAHIQSPQCEFCCCCFWKELLRANAFTHFLVTSGKSSIIFFNMVWRNKTQSVCVHMNSLNCVDLTTTCCEVFHTHFFLPTKVLCPVWVHSLSSELPSSLFLLIGFLSSLPHFMFLKGLQIISGFPMFITFTLLLFKFQLIHCIYLRFLSNFCPLLQFAGYLKFFL